MKKVKNLGLSLVFLTGMIFAFSTQNLNAQDEIEDPNGGSWVCCQSVSIGCVATNGMFFPWDYPYFGGPFCP